MVWHQVYSCGSDVLGFSEIGRTLLSVVFKSSASTMIRCDTPLCVWPLWLFAVGWINAGERIDPCARTDPVWPPFKTGGVGVGTSRSTDWSRWRNRRCCSQSHRRRLPMPECMFKPGLANLFEPFGVVGATAHSIQILRDDWMIRLRQCEPIQRLGSRCYRKSLPLQHPPAFPHCQIGSCRANLRR